MGRARGIYSFFGRGLPEKIAICIEGKPGGEHNPCTESGGRHDHSRDASWDPAKVEGVDFPPRCRSSRHSREDQFERDASGREHVTLAHRPPDPASDVPITIM